MPKLAWPKADQTPAVPFAVPGKAAPFLPAHGGVAQATAIPNGLMGRKACDVLQREI